MKALIIEDEELIANVLLKRSKSGSGYSGNGDTT